MFWRDTVVLKLLLAKRPQISSKGKSHRENVLRDLIFVDSGHMCEYYAMIFERFDWKTIVPGANGSYPARSSRYSSFQHRFVVMNADGVLKPDNESEISSSGLRS